MPSDYGKKTIVLTLALASLALNIIFALPVDPLSLFWYKVRLYYWGWVPAFILPSSAIVVMLYWKLGGRILRTVVVLSSIISLILAGLLFFGLYFISHLHF